VLNYPDKWDKCLPLAEFSYNNSYQESLKMAPSNALYGCHCRTPMNWIEPGERMIFGPDLVTEADEIVHCIQADEIVHGNKAMPTSDTSHLSSKQATTCTFVPRPCEV
jgi:hypothetical protein